MCVLVGYVSIRVCEYVYMHVCRRMCMQEFARVKLRMCMCSLCIIMLCVWRAYVCGHVQVCR